jgi:hypothetical protein
MQESEHMELAASFSPTQLAQLGAQINVFGGIEELMKLKNEQLRHQLVASSNKMNLRATQEMINALNKA